MTARKLISIGVLDSQKNSLAFHMLREMFMDQGFKLINHKKNELSLLKKGEKLVILSELTEDIMEAIFKLNLSFDIVIHMDLGKKDHSNPLLKRVVQNAKYIIINIDDKNYLRLLGENVEGLIVSYGINRKATLTTSSFLIANTIQFNLCQQREILTMNGLIVEPMEVPITLNLIGRTNIYYGLASIACGLILGMDIGEIKEILTNIKGQSRHLEKIYEGEYTIIDSYCNKSNDYNLVLEEIQNLKYKNLYILNGIEMDQGIGIIEGNLKAILDWYSVLNVKKLFLHIDERRDFIKNNINVMLLKENVDYQIYFDLDKCLYEVTRQLEKNDLLMILARSSLIKDKKLIN